MIPQTPFAGSNDRVIDRNLSPDTIFFLCFLLSVDLIHQAIMRQREEVRRRLKLSPKSEV